MHGQPDFQVPMNFKSNPRPLTGTIQKKSFTKYSAEMTTYYFGRACKPWCPPQLDNPATSAPCPPPQLGNPWRTINWASLGNPGCTIYQRLYFVCSDVTLIDCIDSLGRSTLVVGHFISYSGLCTSRAHLWRHIMYSICSSMI